MNLTTDSVQGIAVVRVGEARLMYPLLSEFAEAVSSLIASGKRRVIIDLSAVGYVDSASIGCFRTSIVKPRPPAGCSSCQACRSGSRPC